ncbi:Acetophenone carboxylase gamma subunit [Tsuneonella dongtanensis]|uniref:Acetophenone carboxylase gamma subunit n=1 Tax=Tsuneonella dongtanensis TaxID=692370 RepID=A0A1B2ABC6_9SPHN|nr:hydantoinase B/oxoprolinase family protein [Tsuneonella dongtanensis]ANY19473.1 Acetophenone carboxylase gamma subunit [Tsuneonella dongtanensis]
MADNPARWQFWIDRGGTFTDVVARGPDGRLTSAKLLSEDPAHYADAAIEAMRRLTGVREGALPPADIRIGTTIATNALLERKGEPVLLAVTKGFGDLLAIGTQERPDIFALEIEKPAPLPAEVLEIDERVTHEGEVLVPLDREAALAGFRAARARGIGAVGIALMHGYRHTAHEAELAELAREAGFAEIAVSHRVSPLAKLVGRADTTSADAYLSPVLRRYVDGLTEALGPGHNPLFMQSNGGLAAGSVLRGKDAILSGPAGGIVGMAETAKAAGFERVIGFDMGGTSTDVSLFAGTYERDSENRVAGVRIRAPMLRIHTVAAGGGSICRFDGARFLAGPESAGAQPGPACYRQGGPLTVTDCNLILGKLQPDHFPSVFGPEGNAPLDLAAARARMDAVLAEVVAATGRRMTREEAAEGFVAVAVAQMAQAIRAVSVAKGHDVARFALNCFGGAGGQHACLVADALGIGTVLVHPLAGVLSAYGMGLADRRAVREATLGIALDGCGSALQAADERLADEARGELVGQGVAAKSVRIEGEAHIRLASGDSTIPVPLADERSMRAAFAAAHRARFGYDTDAPLTIDMLRIEAVADTGGRRESDFAVATELATRASEVDCHLGGEARRAVVIERAALVAGQVVGGPALIVDPVSTLVVEPGWSAAQRPDGMLVLTRGEETRADLAGTAVDPVRLEIFGGLFMGIAEEMGAALQHSASSVNIRERLDFSCAVFDASGNLIANAPHIPVHLGSMGDSVRTILASRSGAMQPGDAYALNAPYAGGTHLPDITVIAPVFVEGGAEPAFFVAARGHHADIGGIAPGSMPSNSRTIADEGVVLDDVLIARGGRFLDSELTQLLTAGEHPARNPAVNLADLAAQVAACRRGGERLLGLVADHGADTVAAYMGHLLDFAEGAVRDLLGTLGNGSHAVEMDNGARISVRVEVDRGERRAAIDFAGTSPQLGDNFNAPRPVVRAACLYAMRTLLTASTIPLNDGFLRPVEIRVPPRSMLSPEWPAAVVAGNVETSQAITDALLGALGAQAGSQGTMNNFTFGDAARQYYETIAGGAGAGPGFAGADAVQTHMTNSRLTDPEVLEARFPVLVEAFAIRRGSGGAGAWRGGDGAVRRVRFRAPMRANVLSNRRKVAPRGLSGGSDGAPGINRIERADGTVETLCATASADMAPGDVFVIETPGGGGWGSSD